MLISSHRLSHQAESSTGGLHEVGLVSFSCLWVPGSLGQAMLAQQCEMLIQTLFQLTWLGHGHEKPLWLWVLVCHHSSPSREIFLGGGNNPWLMSLCHTGPGVTPLLPICLENTVIYWRWTSKADCEIYLLMRLLLLPLAQGTTTVCTSDKSGASQEIFNFVISQRIRHLLLVTWNFTNANITHTHT